MVNPPWSGLTNGFTLLFEAFFVQLSLITPVKSIAKFMNVHDTKLWRLLEKYVVGTRVEEDFSEVNKVGIDETSMRKHHDYVSLLVDLDEKRALFVTKEGKDNTTVKRFAADLRMHGGVAEQVEFASIDMSPAFFKGVTENLPEAEITFDKLYLVKAVNEAVNAVRVEEVKTQPILKGTRFLLLKNEDNLTQKQILALNEIRLSKLNLKSYRAKRIREAFQAIYKTTTRDDFEILLNKWYYWAGHSHLEPIKDVAKTIKSHWDGVLAWFDSRINNGILEGLNSVIQAAKSKARGFRNFKYFRTMIYLLTRKFDYSKIDRHYVPL